MSIYVRKPIYLIIIITLNAKHITIMFHRIMSEYWKSLPKFECPYCKVWVTDNKPVRILCVHLLLITVDVSLIN